MIIVTGATGFIGSALIWELNNRNIKNIIAVDVVRPDARPGILTKRNYEKFLTHTELWDFLNTQKNITCEKGVPAGIQQLRRVLSHRSKGRTLRL